MLAAVALEGVVLVLLVVPLPEVVLDALAVQAAWHVALLVPVRHRTVRVVLLPPVR